MATSPCFLHINSIATKKPGSCLITFGNQKLHGTVKFHIMKAKAADSDHRTQKNSVICGNCDGNGAVLCSQFKDSGINSVDIFNGQFKAGESCWLCGGKRHVVWELQWSWLHWWFHELIRHLEVLNQNREADMDMPAFHHF